MIIIAHLSRHASLVAVEGLCSVTDSCELTNQMRSSRIIDYHKSLERVSSTNQLHCAVEGRQTINVIIPPYTLHSAAQWKKKKSV